MKTLPLDQMARLGKHQIPPGGRFRFRCHPGISCFNRCCRNLNLFLYPYDVLRLKNRLGLTSGEFIERHADLVLRPSQHFPDVLLRMAHNPEHTCPFLGAAGCDVYADRPDACRSFPVEYGLVFAGPHSPPRTVAFFRPPEFCRGQDEDQFWTLETWGADQQAQAHHRMTRQWAELRTLFQEDPWEGRGPDAPKGKMAFMATYNVDAFREFVFQSSFLARYRVPEAHLAAARGDDQALLELGFEWVKVFLGHRPSNLIRLR